MSYADYINDFLTYKLSYYMFGCGITNKKKLRELLREDYKEYFG